MKRILIDVDGVLNFDKASSHSFDVDIVSRGVEGTIRLDRRHGQWLLDLAAETNSQLMWATSWLEDANTDIGPRIGLPELPVIDFGLRKFSQDSSSWKAWGVAKQIRDPFIWFDDDFLLPDLLRGRVNITKQRYKVRLIESPCGLTIHDINFARKWLSDIDADVIN